MEAGADFGFGLEGRDPKKRRGREVGREKKKGEGNVGVNRKYTNDSTGCTG